MFNAIQRKRDEEQGFTLIELLIVIIVLGILAAIVVFAVGSTRKDSVSASCKTNVKSIQLSLEAQNTKNGEYPDTQANAVATSTNGALLKSWPTSSDYTLAYTRPSTSTYNLVVGGSKVTGGTLTQSSTDADLNTACAGT